MLSIGKLGAGQERYYLDKVAEGAEDYYSGEAEGRWLGDAARELGLGRTVEADQLTAKAALTWTVAEAAERDRAQVAAHDLAELRALSDAELSRLARELAPHVRVEDDHARALAVARERIEPHRAELERVANRRERAEELPGRRERREALERIDRDEARARERLPPRARRRRPGARPWAEAGRGAHGAPLGRTADTRTTGQARPRGGEGQGDQPRPEPGTLGARTRRPIVARLRRADGR